MGGPACYPGLYGVDANGVVDLLDYWDTVCSGSAKAGEGSID